MTKPRAVIYARYSSQLQREASIDDQVEVCRRYLESQGWRLVKTYSDAATSGASTNRAGYQALVADARLLKFDVVVTEAVDRLGRRLADAAALQDTLAFLGIRLFTPSIGELTALHIGIMGTMAQLTLKDLGEKTKRGQMGRVRQGRIPAGLAYGYKCVTNLQGDKGGREIVEAEAEVVRRIFREYVAGKTPENIARDLNTEHIAGPGGRLWANTTIRGQAHRGTGVLNNSLYVGKIVWNRCSYVKDPSTGKRVARPNDAKHWETTDAPELRILPDDIWNAAKKVQEDIRSSARGMAGQKAGAARFDLNSTHRAKFLLSGLVVCSECGGKYVISGKDRLSCATRRSHGTCSSTGSIKRQSIEDRVLVGLKERLVTKELAAKFVLEFQAEYERLQYQSRSIESANTQRLAAINRKIDGIMKAIEDGMYQPEMKRRMDELTEEKERLTQLGNVENSPTNIVLHPKMHELYVRKVGQLEELLGGKDEKAVEARELVRSMIAKVIIKMGAGDYSAELHGDLAAILNVCGLVGGDERLSDKDMSKSQLSVVAGARFELTTFRL